VREDGGAGRCGQLALGQTGDDLPTLQQLGGCRRGYRQDAMLRRYRAAAEREWRHGHVLETEVREASASAHYVQQGIQPAQLVEVDLLERNAVDASLHLSETPEDGAGGVTGRRGQTAGGDDGQHVFQVPPLRSRLELKRNAGGGDAALYHFLGIHPPAGHVELLQRLLQPGPAGVDERA